MRTEAGWIVLYFMPLCACEMHLERAVQATSLVLFVYSSA